MRFFSALYMYKQRSTGGDKLIGPLEDYLTECMAECLRALNGEELAELLKDLSGGKISEADRNAVIACADQKGISVKTQWFTENHGRPDLLIRFNGVPTYLFENKVGHHVAQREPSETGECLNQLHAYAKWLKDEHKGGLESPKHSGNLDQLPAEPHLFFVTHWTPVPGDFNESASAEKCLYEEVQRSSLRWWDLCKKLQDVTKETRGNPVARYLAQNFKGFLEGLNMDIDYPTQSSFSALDLYINQDRKFDHLLNGMWESAKDIANFSPIKYSEIDSANGEIYIRRYLQSADSVMKGAFVAVSIIIPRPDSKFDSLTKDIKICLSFGHMDPGTFNSIKEIPKELNVIRAQGDFLICKDLSEFSMDPDKRAEEIFSWVKTNASKLTTIIDITAKVLADRNHLAE
ncbi:hypothetical protein [Parasphingorhabdus sp.]|uniref:hypothetical protein n=1 Tax=Parasphingorhabdus sp. TaxID=2709688 RepID=UPI002F933527